MSDRPDAKTVLERHRGSPQSMAFTGSLGRGVHRTAIELWDVLEQTIGWAERAEARVDALEIWMGAALAGWEVVRSGDEMDVANFAINLMESMAALAAGEKTTPSA